MIRLAIRDVAQRRGITTAYQLMKAANVQPAVAAKWWTNKMDKIAIKTLDKLCTVLECRPEDLLIYKESKSLKRAADRG